MPTLDPRAALTRARAEEVVAGVVDGGGSGDGIGVELELFPVHAGPPTRRLRLDKAAGSAPALRGLVAETHQDSTRLPVRVSYEPGAQLELVTERYATVGELMTSLDVATASLAARAADADVLLVATGMDLWHELAASPQQLPQPRYQAMDAYLAARSHHGAVMMRHTCALQLNLDLGTGGERENRWLAANLLAPVATATFATSPDRSGRVRSLRSRTWQRLDPTRTGFPQLLVAGRGDLAAQIGRFALAADVMLVATASGADPGSPGWRFGDWIDRGHRRHGWPTEDDLRTHLTTLFPEVRARGFIEMRSIDSMPMRDRTAAIVLLAGAILDSQARDRIIEVLEPCRPMLPSLLRRCATLGVRDPGLCALAVEVWSFARGGAARLPGVGSHHLAAVDAFIDRTTVRGRCPADDLAARLRRDPLEAMRWASEPAPSMSEARR